MRLSKNVIRLLAFWLLCSFMLPIGPAALAQDARPRHTDPAWQAFYWNNRDLTGAPIVQRVENTLNFDWGQGSPDRAINTDNFSARWERYIDVTPGNYRFTAVVDDGMRVWVDDELIIDQWREQATQTYTVEKYLGPGHHLIRAEYFDRAGAAVAKLAWTLTSNSVAGWRGEYYNNMSLSGAPVIVRDEAEINFNWSGAPAREIPADNFSVRWSRNLELAAGNYRFTMTVDDGARLFVNGHTLIDAWKVQPANTYTGDIYLPAGSITVQMEYFDNQGGATAKLTWQRVDESGPQITDWKGEYFNNRDLNGTPALVRNDRAIDFDWGNGSPASEIKADDFSVRWSRTLDLPAGDYRFTATVDDGVRVYVSGQLLINSWREQSQTTLTGDFPIKGGRVAVQMEYFEARGGALARLRWERLDGQSGKAVIVDDGDAGFVKGGAASGWRREGEGHNNSLFWTQNNDRTWPDYNWGRWYPTLAAGRYEVFVYIPDRFTTTANAQYWVSHSGGITARSVNQSAFDGGQWVSLGTYTFRGTRDDYVSLADVTGEPRLSRLMAWDAVKWEPR